MKATKIAICSHPAHMVREQQVYQLAWRDGNNARRKIVEVILLNF